MQRDLAPATIRRVRPLRSPDFRLLALSNGLSSLGDELALVALTIKVFELSSGSGIAVAAVLLAGVVPLVVFAPFAGLIVDRTETTGTLALASVAQALIAVGLAFAEPIWLIVALSFLLGSAASIASPAVFAIVPEAVEEEDLTEANANMETVRYIGMVAGPLIAGGLAGALGADKGTRAALLLDAITFLVITSAAASLKVRRDPAEVPEGGRGKGEARRGFAFIRRDRVLLIGVSAVAVTVVFATMDSVAEVFFANDPKLLNVGQLGIRRARRGMAPGDGHRRRPRGATGADGAARRRHPDLLGHLWRRRRRHGGVPAHRAGAGDVRHRGRRRTACRASRSAA